MVAPIPAKRGRKPAAATAQQAGGQVQSLTRGLKLLEWIAESHSSVALTELAQQAGVPFCVLAFEAPAAVLRQRIRQRLEQGGDASEADVQVLESQLQALEPLGPEEQDHALHIDSTAPVDWDDLLDAGGGLTASAPSR